MSFLHAIDWLYAMSGFAVGLLVGMTGVGGGSLMTPLLILLFGWPVMHTPGRAFAVTFLILMCSAAIYLDHHWIVDVLVGLAYALAIFAIANVFVKSSATAPERAVEAS